MAESKVWTTIPNVKARIFEVTDYFLRLEAPTIGPDNFINVAGILAQKALSRPGENTTDALTDKFKIGDTIFLDIVAVVGRYIPGPIHGLELYRDEGTHVIGGGLIIDVNGTTGPIIRSVFVADFVYPMDRCQLTNMELRVGDTATFEALIADGNVYGLWMRQSWPDSKGPPFPIYRVPGIIQKSRNSSVVSMLCPTSDGGTQSVPLYQGAHYCCGLRADTMDGERVMCMVCPSQPQVESSPLQVIHFEPCAEDNSALPQMDGSHYVGESGATGTGYSEVQYGSYFDNNALTMGRASSPFVAEISTKSSFENMGISGNQYAGLVDDVAQRPRAPAMLSTTTADIDHGIDQTDRGPKPPPFLPSDIDWPNEMENMQREDSRVAVAVTQCNQFRGTEILQQPSRGGMVDENGSHVRRLADHVSIISGGRSQIFAWDTLDGGGDAGRSSRYGQQGGSLGKVKPG